MTAMLKIQTPHLLQKLTLSISLCLSTAAVALTPLDDATLSQKTGQNNTLLTVATTGIGENGNPNSKVGFTKLGFQGKLELNANIRKLQLGCGGINGVGSCDIDVDYARFVGISALDADGNPVPDGGPKSAFELINPFFELAIENPDSLVNRKFVGMRVGGEKSRGVLSAGTRPVNADGSVREFKTANGEGDPRYHTGINRISANVGSVVVDKLVVPAKVGLGTLVVPLTIDAVVNEDNNNIFNNLYVSRADNLRLGPVTANGLGLLNLKVDFQSDNRFLHNIVIGGGTEENPVYSDSFFLSLSALGDNKVHVTDGGDYSISRETGGKNLINALAPNPPEDRLQWQVGQGNWKEALRGWSFFFPVIRIEKTRTAEVVIPAEQVVGNLFSGPPIPVTNVDVKQIPVDNCYGGLTFC